MAKGRSTHREDDEHREDESFRNVAHQEEGQEVEQPPADPSTTAQEPRHPVLEHIFGRAPLESVPEGQPLRGLRRPLRAPVADTPEHEPLVPRRPPVK
jgi:hypothetical protein